MDKGIRSGVNAKFSEMLKDLSTLGGKKFRRILLDWTVEQYGVSMPSASTHYNHALHLAKKNTPELVVGLGRPEGKNNGGRKKAVKVEAATPVAAEDGEAITLGDAFVDADADETEAKAPEAAVHPDEQTKFEVRVRKTDVVVLKDVSFDEARAAVEAAKAAKKAKLYYV